MAEVDFNAVNCKHGPHFLDDCIATGLDAILVEMLHKGGRKGKKEE